MIGEFLTVIFTLLNLVLVLVLSAIWFPLPVRDTRGVRYGSLPIATLALILINSLIFIFWQAPDYYQGIIAIQDAETVADLEVGMERFMGYVQQTYTYGFRNVYLREGVSIGAFTTFTSMFMHGDMWHLFGNMFYLWAFGRRVEDSCGPWRFLLFYLFAGMVANLGSALLNPSAQVLATDVPGIGASGAIAGVMGAALILHPGAWISSIWVAWSVIRVPVVAFAKAIGYLQDAPFWTWTPWVPAWMLLIAFLLLNLAPAFTVMQEGQVGGVNTLAHIMGFLSGITIFLFVRKDLMTRYLAGRAV